MYLNKKGEKTTMEMKVAMECDNKEILRRLRYAREMVANIMKRDTNPNTATNPNMANTQTPQTITTRQSRALSQQRFESEETKTNYSRK
jgi:hypothetical protein